MGENPNLVFQSQIHEYCLIPGERKAIQQMIRVSTLVPRHLKINVYQKLYCSFY